MGEWFHHGNWKGKHKEGQLLKSARSEVIRVTTVPWTLPRLLCFVCFVVAQIVNQTLTHDTIVSSPASSILFLISVKSNSASWLGAKKWLFLTLRGGVCGDHKPSVIWICRKKLLPKTFGTNGYIGESAVIIGLGWNYSGVIWGLADY